MATSVLAGYLGLLGKKPEAPAAEHVELGAAQTAALKSNLTALPDIEALAGKFDEFSIDELLKMMDRFSPGTSDALKKIPKILSDQLAGKVPADVLKQIKQGVGSRAWAEGLSPSQRTSLSATAIGETSYSIQQQGVTAAERWISQVSSAAPRFDFSKMFITPIQEAENMWKNEDARYQQEWLANRLRAMPSPTEQAAAGFFNAWATLGENYISSGGGASE